MFTKTSFVATAAALVGSVQAAPAGTATDVAAASACTITSYSQVSGCLSSTAITVSNLQVPAGETLTLEKLQTGTTVTFTGTTTFGYKEWEGPLISVSGTSVTVEGSGTLDGQGAQYWDGEGSNGGKTKPKFFQAHSMDQGTIKGITLLNTPVQAFSVESDGITISGVTINDSAGAAEGHNTDGFDIGSSTGVTIENCVVENQDDCIAINSGTDINISGMTCTGSHGISIGSVGGRSDNTVENVAVSNSKITGGENGLRIKTISGDTGTVSNVTWTGITLSGITDYGIVIEQDYENGSPTGTATSGITIDGVTASDVTGSVTGKEVYVLCGTKCSNFKFSDVDITGGSKGSVSGVTIAGYS